MKKVIILLLALFITFGNAKALEIKSLGLKAKDSTEFTFKTRDEYENKYYMQAHDIYGIFENDDYKAYIRAIKNPGYKDYATDTDLTDDMFALLRNTNQNEYSYIKGKEFKWISMNYKQNDINLVEYYLSWKNLFITITFQSKKGDFSNEKVALFNTFVRDVQLDGKGEVEPTHVLLSGIDKYKEPEKKNYLPLIIGCLVAIGLTYYITRKKK